MDDLMLPVLDSENEAYPVLCSLRVAHLTDQGMQNYVRHVIEKKTGRRVRFISRPYHRRVDPITAAVSFVRAPYITVTFVKDADDGDVA